MFLPLLHLCFAGRNLLLLYLFVEVLNVLFIGAVGWIPHPADASLIEGFLLKSQ